MEYKKRLGEKAEEKRAFEQGQRKLRRKYKIHEDGTILVKKKRLIEIPLNAGAATIRVGATITLCSLATIGLISLLYIEPRTELLITMQEAVEQLHSMLGVRFMGKLKTGACTAVSVLVLVGLGTSSTRLLDTSAEYQRSNIAYRQLREIKDIKGLREVVEDKLKDINPDYIVWLQIEDTPIDYPVIMESDRDYLITGFYGENSIAGILFIRRAQNAFQDKNTVIFGHNMRDGTMFAALKNYLKSEHCKQYPAIIILNKGREYKYELFSVQLLNEDDGNVFTYIFTNDESYKEYLDLMIQKSLVQLTEPDTDKNIITLSTCHREDKRLAAQAFGEG